MMLIHGKYNLKTQIGSGRYGTVYLAERVSSRKVNNGKQNSRQDGATEPATAGQGGGAGGRVAIKVLMKKRPDVDPFLYKVTTHNEIDNMTKLSKDPHPNIVKLEEVLEDETAYYMIEELCGGNTLQDALYSFTSIPMFVKTLSNIIDAVVHCHKNDILYGDLKPSNIVYSNVDDMYKLTDFGSSTILNPKTREGVLFTTSPIVAPPETFKSKTRPIVTTKFDVYSIGILAKTLLVSNPSLYNSALLLDPEQLESFIRACIHENESKRIDSYSMQQYWYDIIGPNKDIV